MESLIKAGCFDEIEKESTRFDILDSYETIVDNINETKKKNYINQMNFFDVVSDDAHAKIVIAKSSRKPTNKDLLNMEKEMLGMYVSGHPLDEYKEYIKKNSTVSTIDLNSNEDIDENSKTKKEDFDNKTVSLCGIITSSKLLNTKSGNQMMFTVLEDMYGSVELVIFPKVFNKFYDLLKTDMVVKVTGKVNIKEGEKPKILVNYIEDISNKKMEEKRKVYIRIPKDKLDLEGVVLNVINDIAKENSGNAKVNLFYEGTNKIKVLNDKYSLNLNDDVLNKLSITFGSDNVKVK